MACLVFCPTCHVTAMSADAKECGMCMRHRSYGLIVLAILSTSRPLAFEWLALEALAEMWIERGRVFRRHNHEIFEEQRGAQRDAKDSYYEGLAEGRQREDAW